MYITFDKILLYTMILYFWWNIMKVKLFDESHEKDLETKVNTFLSTISDKEVIDIKFQVAVSIFSEEQVYCFSAMIVYIE